MGAINNPVMPNNDSMISKASKSSQAAACILLPTIFALIKYSSLWTATKNNNAAIATLNDTPMPITVLTITHSPPSGYLQPHPVLHLIFRMRWLPLFR